MITIEIPTTIFVTDDVRAAANLANHAASIDGDRLATLSVEFENHVFDFWNGLSDFFDIVSCPVAYGMRGDETQFIVTTLRHTTANDHINSVHLLAHRKDSLDIDIDDLEWTFHEGGYVSEAVEWTRRLVQRDVDAGLLGFLGL